MALHEQCLGATDEWYTPPHVFRAMRATFAMDVSSPGQKVTPWIPAGEYITADSLAKEWRGFVWMNPPFGGRNGLVPWLEKFTRHGNGVALVPARQQIGPPIGPTIQTSADIIAFQGVCGCAKCSPERWK